MPRAVGSEASEKKRALEGVFDRAASIYGGVPYFPVLGQWLVDRAELPAGAHVLDVACGHGAVLIPAARQVGPRGQVVGVDLSGAMVEATRATIERLGLTQARALRMDAEQLEFPDASFDFVLCGFSLQFLPHLEKALSEVRRVLRPGGRAVVSTWGRQDESWRWYRDLRQAYQAVAKLNSHSFDRPGDLADRFSRAGFAGIQIIPTELDVIYATEEEWWTMQWSVSGRAGLERLEPGQLERLKADVFERMQVLRQADGFHDRLLAHCTIAVRP
jgi:ubiquinone/menaquinone biosynthesis C-methylase UbiE